MSNADIILQFCREADQPVTAKQIIDGCFPGKPQPYINSTINSLVQSKKLVRNDEVRPYTVRLPMDDEIVAEPRTYSRSRRYTSPASTENNSNTVALKFTENELNETAWRVKNDLRYGEEATIINNCLTPFPKKEDRNIIAMKMALVDMTNSTNLNKHLGRIYLTKLVDKIIGCNFDKRVATGDVSIIGELASNETNLFSFFSKYCLYHNYYVYDRDDFAIFDGIMKNHVGKYLSYYVYKGKTYSSQRINSCIELMRKTYDYQGYLDLIDTILANNNIQIQGKRRKFDWFVWYNNRKQSKDDLASGKTKA